MDIAAQRKHRKQLGRMERRLMLRMKKRNNKSYRTRPH